MSDHRHLWTLPDVRHLAASPDQRGLVVGGGGSLRLVDAETGRVRGTVPFPKPDPETPRFEAAGRQLWVFGRADPPKVKDWWLTRALAWFRTPPSHMSCTSLHGYEWPSMRPLLRLDDRGVWKRQVAADGSFVITVQIDERDNSVVSRWDVPQPRPWAYSIGVPLTLGALIVALSRWQRRAKR